MDPFDTFAKTFAYKIVNLDNKAYPYLEECLKAWSSGFYAGELKKRISLPEGSVVTYLPTFVSDEDVWKFQIGGKIPVPEEFTKQYQDQGSNLQPKLSTDFWIVEKVQDYLSSGNDVCCIFKDPLAQQKDPVVTDNRHERMIVYENEVYYLVTPEDREDHEILKKSFSSIPWPAFCGAFTLLPPKRKFAKGKNLISKEEMEFMVEHTNAFVVSAYDGEGYILWSRTF